MRNFVVILFFVFSGINGYSQFVYYGYPIKNGALKKGDIVIINIPVFSNCRFIKPEEFDDLIELLEVNEINKLRIEINYFYGDSILTEGFSELLYKHFKEILESKTVLTNYHILNNGCRNPIFLRKDDVYYRMFNSRIEIVVE